MATARGKQLALIEPETTPERLPEDYSPLAPEGFHVDRIILCRGSLSTPQRERFAHGICSVFPSAKVHEQLDTPHNHVDLGEPDPVRRVARGKRTLVLGELRSSSAVRCSVSTDDCFHWHFSVYSYCFYGCSFCYLAGTEGVWHSPAVRVYINLHEIVREIDRQALRAASPTVFCLGKLQDGLALDTLTAYSTVLVPFFARHPHARLLIQTKSIGVERLLPLDHSRHTTLAWSLNLPRLARVFEFGAPPVEARIRAMEKCAAAGYPVKAVIQPFIPEGNWKSDYAELMCELLERVPTAEVSVAGICIGKRALSLLERRHGRDNPISRNLCQHVRRNGSACYEPSLEKELFACIRHTVSSKHCDAAISAGKRHPSELPALRIFLRDMARGT